MQVVTEKKDVKSWGLEKGVWWDGAEAGRWEDGLTLCKMGRARPRLASQKGKRHQVINIVLARAQETERGVTRNGQGRGEGGGRW